jgi:hypothetical protein
MGSNTVQASIVMSMAEKAFQNAVWNGQGLSFGGRLESELLTWSKQLGDSISHDLGTGH